MAQHSLSFALLLLAGASLSACSRQDENDASGADPFTTSAAKDDRFGKGFGKAARADPNSEPVNLSEIELPPVSYTTEPVEIR